MGIFDRFKKTAAEPEKQPCGFDYYYSGSTYIASKNYERAAEEFKKGADMDDADCQYKLAELCFDHKTELLTKKEALAMLEKAANQDHLKSQMKLGEMYQLGLGYMDEMIDENSPYLDSDYPRAIYWYTEAAETYDEAKAMYELGNIYSILEEFDTALAWYQKAYEEGYEEALKDITLLTAEDDDYDDEDDDNDEDETSVEYYDNDDLEDDYEDE